MTPSAVPATCPKPHAPTPAEPALAAGAGHGADAPDLSEPERLALHRARPATKWTIAHIHTRLDVGDAP